MARKALGKCTYCRRELSKAGGRSRTSLTKDHVMPKSVGGSRKVKCCRQCNELKGDIHPSVWRWFTENHPAWWGTFRTSAEVATACAGRFGAMVRVSVTGRARRDRFEQLGQGVEA